MIDIDERVLSYERVRAVHAEWCEMLRAVDRCARHLDELDECNFARALQTDLLHLLRRAQLHLRQVAAREAALGVGRPISRPPAALLSTIPPEPEIPRLKVVVP